ncbi:thermonuclease family protein [Paeniglutamicibacter sp.]|uniref:thermonuclease family protein n=1 Tax=Paeniglutamicibacter sp. TaxID=1934391 RepID=UPI00398A358F
MRGKRRLRSAAPVLVLCAAVAAGSWLLMPEADRGLEEPTGASRVPVKQASATVQHVVDGDTVYLMLDGKRTKVRLLNVDAPEIAHPDQRGECFGQEAADFLAKKLPEGSKVELDFDSERLDQYGRTLAALSRKGEFINETLVASGHATAMKVEPNMKFYKQLRAAQTQAERSKKGMFDPANGCT